MGQVKWKLWLIKNYKHKVDATTSLASILCSASSEKEILEGKRYYPTFQFQFQFICFAILHIPHIMQNKMRKGDTKKAVLVNMCLPMINNKLLE